MMNFTMPARDELTEFNYAKKDGSTGTYIGYVTEQTETRVLVQLHEQFDTLKSGEKKQAYRTLEIERITTIERIFVMVG